MVTAAGKCNERIPENEALQEKGIGSLIRPPPKK
jgi:hypothetical protein